MKKKVISLTIIFLSIMVVALLVFNLKIPKPKSGFTELYFVDKLPKEVKRNQEYNFSFAIHSMENRFMSYNYSTYLKNDIINQGSVDLEHDKIAVLHQNFAVTSIDDVSLPIIVRLSNQNQEIHFWVHVK